MRPVPTSSALVAREADRLTSLRTYPAADTAPGAALEALTRLAARICGTPVSQINLVDDERQWSLAQVGSDVGPVPRRESICADVVVTGASLVLPDLAAASRYAGLAMVAGSTGYRSYAGVPLVGRDGLPLGTLCVLDTEPRGYTDGQLAALGDLAEQVVTVLELRRLQSATALSSSTLVPEATNPQTLRRALDNGEFVPHFQPLVDMRTGTITGLEVLLRWEHPTRGLLTPETFLAGLETGSLINVAGREMLDTACAVAADLHRRGIGLPDGIAINVSGQQLSAPGLAREFLTIAARHGVDPSTLVAEITETAEIEDLDLARGELAVLRDSGVRVLADDFGVGWSNLVRVLKLPLTGLKIDKELVTGMVGDPVREHMVNSVVALGAAMGIDVIAEGVETEAVRDRLLELGCRRGQGWLFSRAVPARELPDLLGQGRLLQGGRQPEPRPARPGVDRSPQAVVTDEVTDALANELAELETRRYTDRRGISAQAERLVAATGDLRLSELHGRAQLISVDQASRGDDARGAIAQAQSILVRARSRDEFTVAARSEAVIAWCLFRIGALGEALAHAVDAVRLLPADAPAHLQVDHRMILVLFNGIQTHDDSCGTVFEEVLADAEQLGNPHLLLAVLNNYAWTMSTHNRMPEARLLVRRLEAVSAVSGIALNSTMLETVASILMESGELDRAEQVALVMVDPATGDGEVRALPEAMLTLAKIRRRRGDREQVLELLVRAGRLAEERALPEITATVAMEQCRLLAELGDFKGAYEALSVSHAAWELVRDQDAEARGSSLHALFETEQARRRSFILEELAERDALTGLWNRRHLDRVLTAQLAEQQHTPSPFSVAIVDVDHFKRINDERNHLTGDAVLVRFGELLRSLLDEPGFVARLGGEEFLIALPGFDEAQARSFCEQLRLMIAEEAWELITDGIRVTVSVGYATSASPTTVSRLLGAADAALYSAKRNGRDQVRGVPDPVSPAIAG